MPTCTSVDLQPYANAPGIAAYLKSVDFYCVQYLWSYDNDVRASYNVPNMIEVLGEIQNLSPGYLATDVDHMRELLLYARIGYYHRYGHLADPGLFDPAAIQQQAEDAFQAFAANAHYNDFTSDGGPIASEWIIAIDTAKLWNNFYATFVAIVSDNWNQPPRHPDWYQQYNVYSVFYAFERAVFEPRRGLHRPGQELRRQHHAGAGGRLPRHQRDPSAGHHRPAYRRPETGLHRCVERRVRGPSPSQRALAVGGRCPLQARRLSQRERPDHHQGRRSRRARGPALPQHLHLRRRRHRGAHADGARPHPGAARFVSGGLWGEAPIYANDRMVWFDEGFAEFLTGSAATGGIKPRKHLADMVAADGLNRMNVAQVLSSTYGNFIFYRYAGFFFHFMYSPRRDLLRQFIDYVRAAGPDPNDPDTIAAITGFDLLHNQTALDPAINVAYQAFLDQIVANAASLTDPSTATPPLNALASNDTAQIETLVRTTRLGYLAEATVSTKALDTRFTCRGYLSGQLTNVADQDAAWTLFNANLEELLGDLRNKPLNNFQWTVARFGRIRFQASGNQVHPIADYYVEGPLGPENSVPPPPATRVETDLHSTRLGGGATCTFVNGIVDCTLSIPTQAFPPATPDQVLAQQLEDGLDELRAQLYTIDPPYYRDLDCAFSAASQTLTTQGGDKYMLRPVKVAVKVP